MKQLFTLLLIASTLAANAQKDPATGGGGSGYINDSLTSGSILSNGLYATPTLDIEVIKELKEIIVDEMLGMEAYQLYH